MRSLIAVFLVSFTLSTLWGVTENVGGVSVSCFDTWPLVEEGGYYPLIMNLYNSNKKRVVCVIRGRSKGIVNTEKRVLLLPLERKSVTLHVGDFKVRHSYAYGYYYTVTVQANGDNKKINVSVKLSDRYYGSAFSILFICRKKPGLIGEFENAFADPGGYRSDASIGVIAPSLLPEGWISYAGLDFAMIDGGSIGAIDQERGSDIGNWVHWGGMVIFYNAERMQDKVFSRIFRDLPFSNADASHSSGRGNVHFLKGFPSTEESWKAIRATSIPGSNLSISEKLQGNTLGIPGVGDIPVKVFLVIIIIFSIFIGPVNFLFFKLKKKEIYILATIPATAFIAGFILFLYSISSDGLTAKGVVASMTELSKERSKAYTDASFSLYNATFGKKDFVLSPDDMLFYSGEFLSSAATLASTGGEMIYRNFVTQRVMQSFRVKNVVSARERVTVTFEKGIPFLSNGLGTGVRFVIVAHRESFYSCENVMSGEKKKLEPCSRTILNTLFTKFYTGELEKDQIDAIARFNEMVLPGQEGQKRFLSAGTFVAVTEENPFMRPALEEYKKVGSLHIIYGAY